MAKNWTVAEVANVIATRGLNNEEVMDFGRRFPVTTNLITAALAGDKEAIKALLEAMPAYVTMGKMEKNFKEATGSSDVEDTDVETEEADADEEDEEESGEKDYSEMNNKQLKAELRKAGFKSAEIKGKNKAAMLEMLKGGVKAADLDEEEDEDEDEAEDAVDYSKMTAKELYKLCKSKGIDVEQKKPAKYYIDAINAAEEEAEDEADEADEWEEEEETPKKPAKGSKGKKAETKETAKPVKETAKPAKGGKATKPAKASDDEWDI